LATSRLILHCERIFMMAGFEQFLPLHPGLRATTRLGRLASDESTAGTRDWLILISAGVIAACASTFLDYNLKIPGHAILRVAFPMAIGLALVPRRGAGSVMGAAAILTAGVLRIGGTGGDGMSLGALTSLAATGSLMDLTLRRTNGGWKQYLAFAGAGLASNLLAFAVRGGAKVLGFEHGGGRRLGEWLVQAGITYPLCGIVAGLISGAIWFYARRRGGRDSEARP
jgi:hypothetical protein